ncbi:MAG TPA: GAF domain-containing sensor histidine kinase, partial [Actinomycetota bacterium]
MSGLRDADHPTLAAVGRRQFELWMAAAVTIVAGATVFVLSLMRNGRPYGWVSAWIIRWTVIVLCVSFSAYVYEKAQALQRMRRQLGHEQGLRMTLSSRLDRLSEVGRLVNSELDLQKVLDLILLNTVDLLGGSGGAVMLPDGQHHLRTVSALGEGVPREGRVAMGEGIAGTVAQTREPVIVPCEAGLSISRNGADGRTESRGALSVPLLNRGELVGVLVVYGEAKHNFSLDDAHHLLLFAEQAAMSVANARMYEAERQRVTELTEMNRMKSEFIATVSHELRTPLTSILSSAITLRTIEVTPEEREEFLDAIERQGQRLLRLIEDLLKASELERERASPFGEQVDVAASARSVARTYADAFGSIEVTAPESCMVVADEDILQQVLVNLIDNAYKYGAPPVRVQVEPTDRQVLVSVIDAGPGIPPDLTERIFERFTRLEPSSTRPGIGLGLPIVRQLVNACGGR